MEVERVVYITSINFLGTGLTGIYDRNVCNQSSFLPSDYVIVLIYHLLNTAISYLNATFDILCYPQQCYYLLQVMTVVQSRQQHLLPFFFLF